MRIITKVLSFRFSATPVFAMTLVTLTPDDSASGRSFFNLAGDQIRCYRLAEDHITRA
jgi:hypothetical protein